jgi:iron complex outermembrane recepter protein
MIDLRMAVSATALAAAGVLTSPVQAADAPAAATATSDGAVEAVIVTGTRTTGLKAADSPAPIEVVGADALKHVGQPDLIQGLAQNVPSFTAEALGGDTANLTLSARLRGVSPNDTLVLVDGKRRHTSGNLHVLSGPYQGSATADIGLIPVAGIDHVEVLLDGAAAQYGTDAIAGVVNIILKKNAHGATVSLTGGQYYKGDGETGAASFNGGFEVGDKGFINFTAEERYHNFSQRGGADKRVYNQDGTIYPGGNPNNIFYPALPGAPKVNHIVGDALSHVTNLLFNAGYDLDGGIQLYSFGSYSHRTAQAYENYRVPSKVIASPTLGVAGHYTDPGELIFAPYGFNPKEALTEDDYALTLGAKGETAGWAWDVSITFGEDQDQIYTLNSANRALFIDTHFTPTNFHDGEFISQQWTNNIDISRKFEIGLATPLNVAFGWEGRTDWYGIRAGEWASTYKEGSQSYPGFQSTDAGTHHRTNNSGYLDLSVSPVKAWSVDGAVRAEHYSDFGDTTVGKFTSRYDFSPEIAVRGTASTGFRAPTLAEEYYSATNVSPSAAVVQLPSNSAAAKLLGFPNLKPETSDNYSLGLVLHPLPKLSATLDVYDIKIKNRIVGTGTLFGLGGVNNAAAVLAAIAAHGNTLDPTVQYVGVSLFTNGINTETKGAEVTVNYASDFGDYGHVDWSVSGNYNDTTIKKINATPSQLLPQSLFDDIAKSDLTTASPKYKVAFGAYWSKGPWSANLRETIYGKTSDLVSPNGAAGSQQTVGVAAITDLEGTYAVTKSLKLSLGANNLFDKKPPNRLQNPAAHSIADGSNVYDAPIGISPYGINGGYYYARAVISF